MTRRVFLALGATLMILLGCGRRPEPHRNFAICTSAPPRDQEAVIQFVKERIAAELPETPGSQFALLTLLSIAGFVIQVVQYCKAENVLKQHAAVKSKPNGAVARKLRSHLAVGYCEQHRDASLVDAKAHADASVKAFGKATPEELTQLHADLQQLNHSPTPIDLFEFSESLST